MHFAIYGFDSLLDCASQAFEDAWTTCWKRDVVNRRPEHPPTYSSQEQVFVDAWRLLVSGHILLRTSGIAPRKPDSERKATLMSQSPELTSQSEHRALRIPELLEMVLHHAGTEMQVVALNVSTTWRASAVSAITCPSHIMEFRHPRECEPIEYGQTIKFELPGSSLISEGIEPSGIHALMTTGKRNRTEGRKYVYFPARSTQIPDLPQMIQTALSIFNIGQAAQVDLRFPVAPVNTESFWLDFSQVQANPYFYHLFAQTGYMQNGHWEIPLNPSSNGLFPGRSSGLKLFLESIGPMHVTYPLCKTLGIYHLDTSKKTGAGFHKLLVRLHNKDGIRISQLVNAMEQCTPTITWTWEQNVDHFLEKIVPVSHWIDDIWQLPGTPKLIVRLDSHEMTTGGPGFEALYMQDQNREADVEAIARYGYNIHITRGPCLAATPFRAIRESEWLPQEVSYDHLSYI